ncbi:50S ribosomal protein L24 [Chlamydiota bacterium]
MGYKPEKIKHKTYLKKNDTVVVIAGKDKWDKDKKIEKSRGRILQVLHMDGKVLVEGINFNYKNTRPTQENQQGGIIQKESPISIANVLLYCNNCKKGVRVKKEKYEDGEKSRICKKCGEII